MNSITIPSKAEVAVSIERTVENLDRLGITHNVAPVQEIDWANYIEDAQEMLNLSGSGHRSGTIYISDSYPLKRTLNLDAHVTIEGKIRAKHHVGSSHGFYAEKYFSGLSVLKWRKISEAANYSNFGAGIHQVHVQSVPGVSGVSFRGAQQSARVDNLVVRGFGPATGLSLGGDTYTIRDLFVDAAKGGDPSATVGGSTGIRFDQRVYSLALNNITTHNCETGLEWADAHQVRVTNMETELTSKPIVSTYNAIGVSFRNCSFRHTEEIIDIQRARWPNDYGVEISGMMSDHGVGRVRVEGKETVTGKAFDLVIEGDGNGVAVRDMKKIRAAL
tara:strand:- start:2322 stop:3317 length:996 start_codon:yes stop_codon:yes gene_type:complete